jgi:serine/threonine-protein phosphatase 2A regulatory subunit A
LSRITRLRSDLPSLSKSQVVDLKSRLILGFCKLVPTDVILGEILTPIKELVSDPNPQVRAAFGENLSGLAPILGKEATIEHLLPMFLQMLKDDDSKVRLNIISRLELVNAGMTVIITL